MAKKNRYVIRFELPNGGVAQSPVSKSSADGTDSESSEDKTYWGKNADSARNAIKKIVSVTTAMSVADKLISNDISVVSLSTGATEYEQKLQFGYSTAKSIAAPLVVGAYTGGLAGAAIGLVFSFAMQGLQWAQNQRVINMNRNLENISIGMANIRAGVTGSRSTKQ